MGCSQSKDLAWQGDGTTFDNPSISSAPSHTSQAQPVEISATDTSVPTCQPDKKTDPPNESASPLSPSPAGMTVDTSRAAHAGNGSVSVTPNGKKLTLLQSRSISSVLSVNTSGHELMDNSNLPLTPSLDVVVPDDFRKKYKMLSVLAEKNISSFAFHATPFNDEDDSSSSEHSNSDDVKFSKDLNEKNDNAAVVVYKGIDRQKKYVIVERTLIDTFKKSTVQIEYFDRIDLLRRINHVCIPSILDVFDSSRDYTIVLQYGVGKSVAELMAARGAISNKESIKALVLALIDSLKHLHKLNIAHRNISCKNMIVSRFNHFSKPKELRVVGLERLAQIPPPPFSSSAQDAVSAPPPAVMTPKTAKGRRAAAGRRDKHGNPITVAAVPEQYITVFCAPELSIPNHTLAVDLYSLGMVIYSLINGSVPKDLGSLDVAALSCSSKLKHLIKKMLDTDPEERYSLRKVEKYFMKSFMDEDQAHDFSDITRMKSNSTTSSKSYDEDDGGDQSSSGKGSACSSVASYVSGAPSPEKKKEVQAKKREERILLQQQRSQEMLEAELVEEDHSDL